MNPISKYLALLLLAGGCGLAGCSTAPSKSPDVTDAIKKSLDQPPFKDVSVSQDRDKGVVTLDGHVASEGDKSAAESIARSNAAGQVVADQIAVIPPADESAAKTVNSDLDGGIKSNLDAALVMNKMNKDVKYSVKNGVVTLSGNVRSEAARSHAEAVATRVPNVAQVVNELQVRDQKATSSNQ